MFISLANKFPIHLFIEKNDSLFGHDSWQSNF